MNTVESQTSSGIQLVCFQCGAWLMICKQVTSRSGQIYSAEMGQILYEINLKNMEIKLSAQLF